MSVSSVPPPIRSTFVSVLGWIFVCLAGLGTLIGILQNLMLQLLFLPVMQQQMATQPLPPNLPASTIWLAGHFVWIFRGVLLLMFTMLVAAIGLLLRRNWGRLLFIGLMGLAIAYQLLGLIFQWWFMGSMQHMMPLSPNAPPQFADGFRGFILAMQVFGSIMAIGFSVLFGWIIKRLCSDPIRFEFGLVKARPTLVEKQP
jgi:hypothetical protein